jgi:hypothetical protein
MKFLTSLLLCATMFVASVACAQETKPSNVRKQIPEATLHKHLQDISVTIRAGRSEGSGIIIQRKIDGRNVNFIWTAAHVVNNTRNVRTVIKGGVRQQIVEFADVQIIKELIENGRRVGELKMEARVLAYSDADFGEDLALLVVLKTDFIKTNATFLLQRDILPLGTRLFHVGSLRGQMGANSMTDGILSQVGRVRGGTIYDQTTVTAFPGSSGGGVYVADGPGRGRCMGMIVRGAGESFNLIVPVRRMHKWAVENDLEFAIDERVTPPSMAELRTLRMKGGLPVWESTEEGKVGPYKFLIRLMDETVQESK